ncbi:hypothetical protein [Chitinophaga alhagiae]|nr:hypothetical protein [Chitinophaga alhagiae]
MQHQRKASLLLGLGVEAGAQALRLFEGEGVQQQASAVSMVR